MVKRMKARAPIVRRKADIARAAAKKPVAAVKPITKEPMKNTKLKDALDWVKSYFLEHPHATVDQVAREASRCHKAVHKTEISRIRRDVRQKISAGLQGYAPEPIESAPVAPPFNPPRIKLPDDDPEADKSAAELEAETTAPPALIEQPAAPVTETVTNVEAAKEKYLYELCEQNPDMPVKAIDKLIREKYGSGFFIPVVAAARRLAREVAGLPVEPLKPKPPPERTGLMGVEKVEKMKEKLDLDAKEKQRRLQTAIRGLAASMKSLNMVASLTVTVDAEGGVDYHIKEHVSLDTKGTFQV